MLDGYSGLERFQIYFSLLAFLFMIGSFAGWITEVIYRRIVGKQWINPGLLTGPCLPIYGFGVVILFLYCLLENFNPISSTVVGRKVIWDIIIIVLIGISMTIIELIGGLIFIKGMNLRLWDYSNRWGNYKGVICPLFSLIWTVVGALFYFFLFPILKKAVIWFFNNYFLVFFVGMYFGIMAIDLAHSLNLATKLKQLAIKNKIVIKVEKLKSSVASHLKAQNKKAHFVFSYKSPFGLDKHIQDYIEDETNQPKKHHAKRNL